MALSSTDLDALVGTTLRTREDEITCDEWVERVGHYVEALAEGGDLPSALEVVAHHALICPQCAEELEALREALELPAVSDT